MTYIKWASTALVVCAGLILANSPPANAFGFCYSGLCINLPQQPQYVVRRHHVTYIHNHHKTTKATLREEAGNGTPTDRGESKY
jgi:hypothetical protein